MMVWLPVMVAMEVEGQSSTVIHGLTIVGLLSLIPALRLRKLRHRELKRLGQSIVASEGRAGIWTR